MAALKKVELKDGRIASISFLSPGDSAEELRAYINSFVRENAYLLKDRKATLKEEREWKKKELAGMKKGERYVLIARVGGKLAGTSGAFRGRLKERNNVALGLAIAKPYRGIGLGESLLRLNIAVAKKRFRPKNIYLSVFAPNRPARSLYRKLGFKEFAVFPKWLLHGGKYVDHVMMKL